MGFADADWQEGNYRWNIRTGHIVSFLHPINRRTFFQWPITNKLIAPRYSICAITIYRLRMVVYELSGGDPNTSTNNFLIGLEVVLGVLNACLPVLKPSLNKTRVWIKSIGSSSKTNSSLFGKLRTLTQVSRKWDSRRERRNGTEELDSIFEMEGYGSNRNAIETISGADRLVEMKDTEIHVQKDVDVERASNHK